MSLFHYICHRTSPCLGICETVHNVAVIMVFCTSPNPQAGEPPFVDCLWLLIPYWQPFLHLQPQDMPCHSDRDPTTTGQILPYFQGKCVYPYLRQPPKNQMSAKKKYFTINFVCLIHRVWQILSTFNNQCQSPCSQLVPYLPHTLLTFPSSSLPSHNISPVPSIALDTQDFLKLFTFTSGEMQCHTIMNTQTE
jgi:hypothetical protein